MKKDVLGIKIDDINLDQAVETVTGWLSKPGKHYIVTPNPEVVVMAQKDQELKNIINSAGLAIPDGVGLRLATDIVCNTPGIDLMEALIKVAEEKGFTVALLGGKKGIAKRCAECLLRKYPKLKIVFAESGGEVDNNGNVIARREEVRRTSECDEAIFHGKERLPRSGFAGPRNDKSVDLLFVAFGPPKQEKWIAENLAKIPVKAAMGVGGAFDYLSSKVPRAPVWVRGLGLEWLFRLVIQPWRIKRQLALVKYLYLLLRG